MQAYWLIGKSCITLWIFTGINWNLAHYKVYQTKHHYVKTMHYSDKCLLNKWPCSLFSVSVSILNENLERFLGHLIHTEISWVDGLALAPTLIRLEQYPRTLAWKNDCSYTVFPNLTLFLWRRLREFTYQIVMEDQKCSCFIHFWSILLYLNNEVLPMLGCTHSSEVCWSPSPGKFYFKLSIAARMLVYGNIRWFFNITNDIRFDGLSQVKVKPYLLWLLA